MHSLGEVRHLVARGAESAGIRPNRVEDLVLSVSEVAANSIRHGGGRGWLRTWETDGSFVCEVRDRGIVTDPLVGRTTPRHDAAKGRGLWLANQLCDLVQLRSSVHGTEVRLHMRPD
jgi:anti-sigma regulatory factor (Ser/Thr protein kinase)